MFRTCLLLAAAAVLFGCSDSSDNVRPAPDSGTIDSGAPDADTEADTGNEPTIDSVVIAPESPIIGLGERLALTATPVDGDGNEVTQGAGIAIWESSNPAVAPVSSSGEVVGASVGTTSITATYREISASIELSVTEVAVDSVEVLPPRVVFTIGDTFTFLANPLDASGERIDNGLAVTWTIQDDSTATVTDDGVVTAVAAGTTNLVATVEGVEGTAEIIVEDAVLTGITIDQSDSSLPPTDSENFTVSYTWQADPPSNLPTVEWSSSDDAIATVLDGVVRAVTPGTATITAAVGSFTDSVNVTVVGDFNEVAAGDDHACARVRTAVFCWGDNSSGQLGHIEPNFARAGTVEFEQVVAGRAHTCARTSSDDVWCWGANDRGQLGLGDTMARSVPTQLTGTYTGNLRASGDVTCAGTECWGDLPAGVASSPTSQTGELFVGAGHSCVVSGGATTCSGVNDQGQLGINSLSPTGSGTPVGGYTFGSLSLGEAFTCGIVSGGGLACWGDGDMGQVGDGNFTDSQVPILVPLTTTVGDLETGDNHVCVRLADGSAQCWGSNVAGQLGDSSRSNRGTPTDVEGNRTWSLLSAEGDQTCGLDDGGAVWCWGNSNATPVMLTPAW